MLILNDDVFVLFSSIFLPRIVTRLHSGTVYSANLRVFIVPPTPNKKKKKKKHNNTVLTPPRCLVFRIWSGLAVDVERIRFHNTCLSNPFVNCSQLAVLEASSCFQNILISLRIFPSIQNVEKFLIFLFVKGLWIVYKTGSIRLHGISKDSQVYQPRTIWQSE